MKNILKFAVAIALTVNYIPQNMVFADSVQQLYVAPYGSYSASGTIDEPLLTLEGAKQRIRKIKNTDKGIEVIFREGTYRFKEGVEFSKKDSGTESAPITYKAYENEKVKFKGSVIIDASDGSQVTDSEVRDRLCPEVRDKLVVIDLKKQKFPYKIEDTDKVNNTQPINPDTGCEYVNLYLNGKEQPIAQWPNGTDNFAQWSEVVKSDNTGNVLRYIDDNPSYWKNIKNAWVSAFFELDYRMVRFPLASVDTNNKTIFVSGQKKVSNITTRRWKVMNLLEELDSPGEWYVDSDKMLLYYYPSYTLKSAPLEMSVLQDNIVTIKDAEYINFEGIEFSQSRRYAIEMVNVNHININKCRFFNLDRGGINGIGRKYSKRDLFWYQKKYKDGVYDSVIENCEFNNIGASCIAMSSGDIDTLKEGNVIIRNNVFYNFSDKNKNAEGVTLNGCGIKFLNNYMSNGPFHAVNFWGNNHEIKYNEIHNVCRIADDVGVIYTGRNYLSRGNEIAYNYIHDIKHKDVKDMNRHFLMSVYLDDSQSGQRVHHNIFNNVVSAYYTCGQDNYFNYNTIVNAEKYAYNISGNYENDNRWSAANMWKQQIENTPDIDLYDKVYSNVKLGATPKWRVINAWVQVKQNLAVSSGAPEITESAYTYGTVEDNVNIDTCDDFADPENQDFRLKSGSDLAKKMPEVLNEDNFNMSDIGVQGKSDIFGGTASEFRQIYPTNGDRSISSDMVRFDWEDSYGADRYKLVVASDRDLKNVVYEKDCDESMADVSVLESGKTYYWKVYAENLSREFEASWESNSTTYMFVTAPYDDINTNNLASAVTKAEKDLLKVQEGNSVGDYTAGTISGMKALLKDAEKMISAKIGKYTQKQIDYKTEEINNYLYNHMVIKDGYINFGRYLKDTDKWIHDTDVTLTENNTAFAQKNASFSSGITGIHNFSNRCILKFRAKINNTGSWLAVGLTTMPTVRLWDTSSGQNKGYYFAMKPTFVEYQRNMGEKNELLEQKDVDTFNDGKFHDYEVGVIQLHGGTLAFLKIDDQVVYDKLDTSANRVTGNLEFSMFLAANASIEFDDSENIPSTEAYTEFISEYKNAIAEEAYEQFSSKTDKLVMMRIDCGAIVSENAVTNVSDAPPIIKNSTTLVPLRAISESFGADVEWVDSSARITYGGKTIVFKPGQSVYTVNNTEKTLVQPAEIVNNRIMIPIRDMAESFDKKVVWDDVNKLILIGDRVDIVIMNDQKILQNAGEALLNYK